MRHMAHFAPPPSLIQFGKYVQAALDRESPDARNGAFILEVSATELLPQHLPEQIVTTEITIIIEVASKKVSFSCSMSMKQQGFRRYKAMSF